MKSYPKTRVLLLRFVCICLWKCPLRWEDSLMVVSCCLVKHDCVYEPCQRLQPLCSQVSHPLTSDREAAIVRERMSSGYPASVTQKAGKLALCYKSIGDRTHLHKSNGFCQRILTQDAEQLERSQHTVEMSYIKRRKCFMISFAP